MKKPFRTLLALFTAAVLLCGSLLPVFAENSGSCGDKVTWSFDESSGVLTVSGEGAMTEAPWEDLKGSVKKVVIEQGVTGICDCAFRDCVAMTEVKLPDGITEMGESAFENCMSLTSFTFPTDTKVIPPYCFCNCVGLTRVSLPEGLTSILDCAFCNCPLTSVSLPRGTEHLGSAAFAGTALTEITIPQGITNLGEDLFADCTALKKVSLPDGLEVISVCSFANCSALTELKLPETVTLIGPGAFRGCTGLTDITIPASVEELYSSALTDIPRVTVAPENKTYVTDEDGALLSKDGATLYYFPHDRCGEYTVPDTVTAIASGAFHDCRELTEILLPQGLTELGGGCFEGCSALTRIEVPSSVASIETETFSGCTALKEIRLPEGLPKLSRSMFEDTAFFNDPDSYTDGALYLSEWLIGAEKSITSCTMLADCTKIADGAFSDCTALADITFSGQLTEIGEYAFSGCEQLKAVLLPEGLRSIGCSAFEDCTALTDIMIPYSVETIGSSAFNGTGFCVPKQEEDGSMAYYLDGWLLYAEPTGVNEVYQLREDCRHIADEAICANPFVSELILPASLTELDVKTATDCYRLRKLTVLNPDCEFSNPRWLYESGSTDDGGFTVCGYEGSTAQALAEEAECLFEVIEPEPETEPTEAPTVPATELPTEPEPEEPSVSPVLRACIGGGVLVLAAVLFILLRKKHRAGSAKQEPASDK